MNAKELTEEYIKLDNKVQDMEKKIEFMQQQISKLQMFLGDHICRNLMEEYKE